MFEVWEKDINDSIRLINNKEDALNWIKSAMIQCGNHTNGNYQFLQKIRSFFRTHHNGKPLTNTQRDSLIMMASLLEAFLKFSCVPINRKAS